MFISGNDTCVQKTVKDNCCKLPFDYNGKTHYTCTDDYIYVSWSYYFWCYIDDDNEDYEECKGKHDDRRKHKHVFIQMY